MPGFDFKVRLTGAAIAGKERSCVPAYRGNIMRRVVFALASLAVSCLFAAGCDKCGDPVKFNVPSLPRTCYDSAHQK